MTKRRLERAVEAVSDDVLTDLTVGERLHCLLKAQARDKDDWVDRLQETRPPEQARSFAAARRLAFVCALGAVYELHTTMLQIELVETKLLVVMGIDHYRDESPSDERLEQAATRAATRRDLFAALFITYHGYRRFAQSISVLTSTWLSLHRNGPQIVADAADMPENWHWRSLDTEWLTEGIEPPEDTLADEDLEALAETRYERLVDAWNDLLAQPGSRHR